MSSTRTTVAAIAIMIGLGFASQEARATLHVYGGAAGRIQNNAALLNQEFRHHYAHVAGYHQLLANSSEIFLHAQRIRLLSANGGSVQVMFNDLRIVDQAYHNLEQLLLVHGRTPQVHVAMTQIASDINSLNSKLASLARCRHHRPVVYYVQPVRPKHKPKPQRNYGEIRSGWTRTLSDIAGGNSHRKSDNRRSFGSR